MTYPVSNYTCPSCSKEMQHDGNQIMDDWGIYSCNPCVILFFEDSSGTNSGRLYYNNRFIFQGTFTSCGKALKLKAFL
jgi:hypothetical protein